MRQLMGLCFVAVLVGCSSGTTVVGTAGESCTRKSDCADGLFCVSQLCTSTAPSGTGSDTTRLGRRGESCTANADCAVGLTCEVGGSEGGLVGRCDLASFGLTPTGKVCSAECKAASDCCELPLGLSGGPNKAVFRSCEDLAAVFPDGVNSCASAGVYESECFWYQTYCAGCADRWACNQGACEYVRTCRQDTPDILDGCPSQSRTGRSLPTNCNSSNKCGAGAAAGCKTDAECEDKPVSDDPTDVCSAKECVCLATNGLCYRKCERELDCAQGYSCDTAKKVCVASGACDNDLVCARMLQDVTAKCVEKACRVPCLDDQDCSRSGGPMGAFSGQVCSSGYCTDVGCNSDSECATSGKVGLKLFCATKATGTAAANYSSAVTN